MTDKEIIELEKMVDHHGLSRILDGLVRICFEKSQHVASSYQDFFTAKEWEKRAVVIDEASGLLDRLQ